MQAAARRVAGLLARAGTRSFAAEAAPAAAASADTGYVSQVRPLASAPDLDQHNGRACHDLHSAGVIAWIACLCTQGRQSCRL